MNPKRDEQLALEMDRYVTARLRRQPALPVEPEMAPEVALAEELLQLAATAEPAPHFSADLEATLISAASRSDRHLSVPRQGSFWRDFSNQLWEGFGMKRIVFTFGLVIVLVAGGWFVWSLLRDGRTPEPEAVAGVTPDATGAAVTPDATAAPVAPDLPRLPSLAGSGLGGGFGGGGGAGPGDQPMPVDLNPLAGAELVLNAPLPAEPTSAAAYEATGAAVFSLEDARQLAARFGFTGPAYTESYFIPEGEEWTPTPVYQFFDGTRQFAVGETYFFFYDEAGSVYVGAPQQPMPFEQSGPIAEAFLHEHGLLDFDYQMVSGNGFDVEIRRVIDGRVVLYPELQASVNTSGQVWSVSSNPLVNAVTLGDYPLRPAAEAWQLVLDQGVDFDKVHLSLNPPPGSPAFEPAQEGDMTSWQRTYADGQAVTLYPYPMVFLPVDGDAAPRIIVEGRLLTGPADALQAIAPYVGQQIFVSGTVRGAEVANQTIELAEWRPQEPVAEYTFREGTLRLEGGRATLVVDGPEAQELLLPDVPAALSDGERIYASGWIETAEDGASVFNWQGIGLLLEEEMAPDGVVPDSFPPFAVNQVTIDQVELIYALNPVWEESASSARMFLLPVWRFKGTADNGDIAEIYVQAVDEAYVAPAATVPAQ